ncbi:MAG: arginine N-succinyltransferase [Bacteriovoracaceae bacterium]|nr:arginine N-succinyltransferase [Bacteriovoracaceae bacterium]
MFVIRPIRQDDLEALMELLKGAGHGLTTLPKDREILRRRIMHSEKSFDNEAWPEGPSGQSYLFVMEELFTGKIVGISGIVSKIGGFQPYYFYRLETNEHKSEMLGVNNHIRSLHLEAVHSGPAEICSLYLDPNFRNAKNGRLLSLSRFLFIADNRKYFEEDLIAEMRGRVSDSGHSPFWDAVGAHFFKIDFPTADYLTMKSKKFIEELLPKYPIVVNLLPQAAQEVVAEVHEQTIPALKILESEGFTFSGWVGVFEPGPVIKTKVNNIRTIIESKMGEVCEVLNANDISDAPFIISRTDEKFRACVSGLKLGKNGVTIPDVTASALKLKIGDKIRYVKLK